LSATDHKRRFCLVLVKPSHYDDDGYVIQWSDQNLTCVSSRIVNDQGKIIALAYLITFRCYGTWRHGSTPYLWTEEQLQRAIEYVVSGKDGEPFVK